MKHYALKHWILFCFHLLSFSLSAQKRFKLTVQLPETIDSKKVQTWLDNGKEIKEIKPQTLSGRQMVLTGNHYSTFAVITLQYPPDSSTKGFANDFFVGEKPGTIIFNQNSIPDFPFASYSLLNVLDFSKDKKQMENYTAAERKNALEYEKQYRSEIFAGKDTTIRNHYYQFIRPALAKKKLQYIIMHPESYYSFYTFKTELAIPTIASPDSLLKVLNRFPNSFKFSDEGNYLNASLQGRLSQQNRTAIDFETKDIKKNTIALSIFKGKRVVLLHFWATWCTPCIRELPALKEIANQYKGKDLQIISLALPSSKYADYLAAISKFQMDWIHIYNDPDLQNKYGNQPIPRICLIDKTGKLTYDNIGLGENDDVELKELKAKLQEIIGN